MTQQLWRRIMNKLEKFMNTTKLSQASIARSLGLSPATISLVKNDKLENVNEENITLII